MTEIISSYSPYHIYARSVDDPFSMYIVVTTLRQSNPIYDIRKVEYRKTITIRPKMKHHNYYTERENKALMSSN